MELFSGLAYGSYLGCIGWTALVISDSVATVGQIFIVQSATMMLSGPLVGVIIDRYKRKNLIIVGQCFIAGSMLILGGLLLYQPDLSISWLFIAVVVVSAARLLYRGSFDGIIRAAVDDEGILQTVARANTLNSMSKAAGMAGVGFIIDWFSTGHGFLASASASVFLLFVSGFLANGIAKTNARGIRGYWSDFMAGLEIFRHNRQIRMLALLATVALPVGQLANAILSSFIRDDLGKGSDFFGMVDAGWAIGGMLAAAIMSTLIKQINNQYGEYYLAVMAGASTIIFSLSTEFLSLTFMHGAMGFFVWLCRIIIGGRVIELCSNENVGRTRVYMEVMIGISATAMSFSPTVIKLEATASYFQYWGIFIIVTSVLLLGWKKLNAK